jgi:C4-dicarboxylate transporter DctQ subunit
MSDGYQPKGRISAIVHNIEESIIAVLLGLMTIVTFINVVMRYGFKVVSHLGVDAMLNLTGKSTRRGLGILATLACILYGVLLLKGAWDYWAPFAGLDATSGRWFPTGFENSRDQGWYELDQVPIPFAQSWLENTFNLGEEYEKLPRVVPYAMLPLAMALMLFRVVQNLIRILRGEIDTIIVSHEAEDAVEEAGASLSKET